MNKSYYKPLPCGFSAGWEKYGNKPVIGGAYGTVYDNSVIIEDGLFKMWYSWRPTNNIAYATSKDGIQWTLPRVVLTFDPDSDWEISEVSRPSVLKKDGFYHMWYVGHIWGGDKCISSIGYARSRDGIHWDKRTEPVLKADLPWEHQSVWCPHVIWDEDEEIFKMWFSGGATFMAEANAIGYATSKDGFLWKKHPDNPIFGPDPNNQWEMYKVSANYVWKHDGWYYMTYLGTDSEMRDRNGMARSRDGITNWQRHPDNPTFAPIEGTWDRRGNCRATVVDTGDGYYAYYNGFGNDVEEDCPFCNKEYIGLAIHKGYDFGFPEEGTARHDIRGYYPCKPKINRNPYD